MLSYQSLPANTRVWIYQAQQALSATVAQEIEQKLHAFTTKWASHNNQLRAFGQVLHQQFIVLMVDESQAGASGCSIDTSVHFIQGLEQEYSINLFDRMTFTYKKEGQVQTASRLEFEQLYASGAIHDDTLVFDNLVATKAAFDTEWLKPLGQSWHKRMV